MMKCQNFTQAHSYIYYSINAYTDNFVQKMFDKDITSYLILAFSLHYWKAHVYKSLAKVVFIRCAKQKYLLNEVISQLFIFRHLNKQITSTFCAFQSHLSDLILAQLEENGAVIFVHSLRRKYFWELFNLLSLLNPLTPILRVLRTILRQFVNKCLSLFGL